MVSQKAWSLYVEAMLYLRQPVDVIPRVRAAARRLEELGHGDTAIRFAELAVLEYSAGDPGAARRTIEIAREWAARMSNQIAAPALAAVEIGLEVSADGLTP